MYHRLKDHAKNLVQRRKMTWEVASIVVIRRRRLCGRNNSTVLFVAYCLLYRCKVRPQRVESIQNCAWRDVIFSMKHAEFLSCFHVTRGDYPSVVHAVAWPQRKASTRNKTTGPHRNWKISLYCVVQHRHLGGQTFSNFSQAPITPQRNFMVRATSFLQGETENMMR